LLTEDTRFFDCLVGYFYISGFHKIYPALENVEKARMLVGLETDRTAYELWERARRAGELVLKSQASTKQPVSQDVLSELEAALTPLHLVLHIGSPAWMFISSRSVSKLFL
jgi:hypothetical protein